jgi:hypothetical protein
VKFNVYNELLSGVTWRKKNVKDIILLLILLAFQVIVLAIIPNLKSTGPFLAKDLLKYTVLIQYVPRLLRIRPLFQEVTRTSGILAETAWAGAVFNLLLYMLASHVNIFNCILQIPLSYSICPSYHGRIFWSQNSCMWLWHIRWLELTGICFR